MNLKKLKQAEEAFFNRYPGGFENPEMMEIGKKHKMDKMITFAQEGFVRRNFKLPNLIVDSMIKVVSRSSMVSLFEKPNSGIMQIRFLLKASDYLPADWKKYCMEKNNKDLKRCWMF